MDFETKRRNRIVLTLLLLAGFVVLTLAMRSVDFLPFNIVRGAVDAVVRPVQGAVRAVTSPIGEVFGNIGSFGTLRRDNLRLREQVRTLRHENAILGSIEDENGRLRKLLGEKRRVKLDTMPAKVLAVLGPWRSQIVIDKGTRDGVSADMAAMSVGGLVGQVVKADNATAILRLINDPHNGAAVEIKRTGEPGIVEGEVGGELRLRYVPRGSRVKKGDKIITSGLGGVYPRGLPVGEVAETRKYPTMVEASIRLEPAADLGHLSELLIIKRKP